MPATICNDCREIHGLDLPNVEVSHEQRGTTFYCVLCDLKQQRNTRSDTIAEIRAILAEPVREILENSWVSPGGTQTVRLTREEWKRLHELLGGDHA